MTPGEERGFPERCRDGDSGGDGGGLAVANCQLSIVNCQLRERGGGACEGCA